MTLRPRKKGIALKGIMSIVYGLMVFCTVAGAMPCTNEQIYGEVVLTQSCVKQGMVVRKTEEGHLCWTKADCKVGHLRQKENQTFGICGPKCECPSWTQFCSFYDGEDTKNSTIKNEQVKEILEKEKPDMICALEPDEQCENKPSWAELNQIELFDGSKHLIREIKIDQTEALATDATCIGSGKTTGSPKYCEDHHCENEGTRFCLYSRNERAEFVSPSGNVIISAWGTANTKFYKKKELLENKICEKCELVCAHEGVIVKSHETLNGVEICSNSNCYYKENPGKEKTMPLPPDVVISEHEVNAKFWKGGELIKTETKRCPPQEFCELKLSWLKMAENVKCAPRLAMVILAILLYCVGSTLFCMGRTMFCLIKCVWGTSCCLIHLKKNITQCFRYCIKRKKGRQQKKDRLNGDESIELIEMASKENIERKLPMKVMLVMAALFALVGFSQVVTQIPPTSFTSITANAEKCTVNKHGERTCIFENVLELALLPNGQEVGIILNDHAQKVAGTLTLKTEFVQAKCIKVARWWTRKFEIMTVSSKRCLNAGTCTDMKCSDTNPTDWIPELESGNHFPGVTACTESCGGLFCGGCFHAAPACLFYRFFAVPRSAEIFAIFDCPEWEKELVVNVKMETVETIEETRLILQQGLTTAWNSLKITPTIISIAPMPILEHSFLSSGRTTSMIEKESLNRLRYFKCDTPKEANDMNCTLKSEACSCHAADEQASCICVDGGTVEKVLRESPMPMEYNGILFQENYRDVVAKFGTAAAEIQLTIAGMSLKTQIELNTCQASVINLSGCYECSKGATVDIKCVTDFGKSLATVVCPSTKLTVHCSPKENWRTVSLHFTRSEIDETCEVICPGGTTHVRLKGNLAFAETPVEDPWSSVKQEIHLDWTPILKNFGDPLNFAIFSLSLVTLITLFYVCLPVFLRIACTYFSSPASVGKPKPKNM